LTTGPRWFLACCALVLGTFLIPLRAESLEFGFGPRVGLTRSQNAVEVGGQFILGDFGIDVVAPLRLRSSLDWATGKLGVPNANSVHFDALHANANLEYVLFDQTHSAQIFPLIGAGWYRENRDRCGSADAPSTNCVTEGFGFNIGGGIEWRALSVEAILGIAGVPTLTLTASLTFRL
jgi:hypothetical protein